MNNFIRFVRCAVIVATSASAVFVASSVFAATYYWDANGTTAGFGTAGGTWGTSAFWSTDGTGVAAPATTNTTTADILNFGNAGTGLATGTIGTTGAAQGFANMTFASGSGAITLGSGGTLNLASTSSITLNNAADTINAILAGGGTNLTISTSAAANTLTLGGANTYTGTTTINRGIVSLTNAGGLGATGPANKTIINGNDAAASTQLSLNAAPGALNIAENFDLNASAAGRVTITSNTAFNHVFSGAIDVSSSGATVVQISSNNNGGSISFTGDITGTLSGGAQFFLRGTSTSANNTITGNLNLTGGNLGKTDAGTWVIGAAGKTYSWGNTSVAVGTLRMGAGSGTVLPTTGNITLGQNDTLSATLDLNGTNQTTAGITFNYGGTAVTSTGTISTGAAGSLTLNGNLTYNTVNTYTGTGGSISGNLNLGGGTRTFTINDSTGTTTEFGISAIISNGTLTKDGAGNLTLTGANTYGGDTIVNAGQLTLGASNVLPNTTLIDLNGGVLQGGTGTTDTVANIDVSGGVLNTGSGTLTVTGSTVVTGGSIGVNSGGGTLTSNSVSVTGPGVINIGNSAATTQTLNVGAGGLTLAGGTINVANATGIAGSTAQLVLGGNVTSTGTSLIDDAAGALGTKRVDLGAVTRTFNVTSGSLTVGVPIIGGGGLTKDGAGQLTLDSTHTYTGITTVQEGTLAVISGNIATTTSITVGSAGETGVLLVSSTGNLGAGGVTLGSGVGATGTLRVTANTATVNGNISDGGGTSNIDVQGGTLTISNTPTTNSLVGIDSIIVGNSGTAAVLSISSTAGTHTAGSVALAQGAGTGSLNMAGGNFAISGSITDGAGVGTLNLGAGTMTVGTGITADNANAGTDGRTGSLIGSAGAVSIGTGATSNFYIGRNIAGTAANTVGSANFGTTSGVTINVASLEIGTNPSAVGAVTVQGSLTLSAAGNNNITATNILVSEVSAGGGSATGVQSLLSFGGASNTITESGAGLLKIGGHKGNGKADIVAGGTLTFGNVGNRWNAVRVGYNDSAVGTGTNTVGLLDMTAGTISAFIDELSIGFTNTTNAVGSGTGTFTMTAGSVDVNTLNLAQATSAGAATGTLNLLGGTLTVQNNISETGGTLATSTLNVNGGALDMTNGTISVDQLALRSGSISNVAAGGATLSGTADALILRNTIANFAVSLTGASGGNVHFENNNNAGGTINGTINMNAVARTFNVEDAGAAADDLTVNGIISGSSGLSKIGAGQLVFGASNTYGGTTTIDNGSVRLAATQTMAGGLTLGAAAGNSNVVSLDASTASATFGGNLLVQTNNVTANTIAIGNGQTLRVNGAVTIGYNSGATSATKVTATGLGTLSIGAVGSPTNANVQIGAGQTTNISNGGTLDMSGLTTFYANLGSGTFALGDTANAGGTGTAGSTIILAANSTIIANSLTTDSPSGNVTQAIKLGSGTNTINVNTLTIGGNANGRSSGTFDFNTSTGSVTIRTAADPVNGRATLNLANVSFNTGFNQTGTFDTTGHSADLRFGTMTIGSRTNNSGITSGTFSFNAGTLDANDLIAGNRAATTIGTSTTAGTVNLGGGTAIFNNSTGPIQLGVNASTTTGSTASGTFNVSGGSVTVAANGGNSFRLGNSSVAGGTATGTINITGGALTVAGDIIRGTATGTSNAVLNLNGGMLDMGGARIGGAVAASNLTSLTFASGTLQNVAQINNGAALNKTTAGTLVLQGTNAYTGQTNVSTGVLNIRSNSALGTAAGGTVVSGGAALEMQNSITIAAEALTLNGAGIATDGALRSVAGTNNYGGLITLGSTGVRINSDLGSLLNITNAGTITGAGFNLDLGGAGDGTMASVIGTTTGTLTKDGAGTWTLSSASTYSGATTVSAGSLIVNGSIANSATTVQNGGTLGGIGTLGAVTINLGGTHRPGNSAGIQNVGNYIENGLLVIEFESALTPGIGGYDQVNVTGTVNIGGTATLSVVDLAGTFTPNFGDVFTIINNDGGDTVTGTFSGAGNGTAYVVDGSTLRLFYNGGVGNNDVVLVSGSGAGAANLYVNDTWAPYAVVDGNGEAAGSQNAYAGVDAWGSTGSAFAAVPGASQPFNGVITINGNTSGTTYGTVDLDAAGAGGVTAQLVADLPNGENNVFIGALTGSSGDAIVLDSQSTGNGNLTVGSGTFNGSIGQGATSPGATLTKNTSGTLTLGGPAGNTYTGLTTVSVGVLELNKTAGVNAIAGDGNTSTNDVLVSGGTLVHLNDEQIAANASVNMTSGAWSLNNRTETIHNFTNSGGTFTTGTGDLIGLGTTITWSGGTNTINAGGTVTDSHYVITGGTNTVEGGAVGGQLIVSSGAGTGLEFGGTSSPTVTLNSDATSAGGIVLNGANNAVTVNASLTSGTAQILSGGSAANPGYVNLGGTQSTWNVNNGSAAVDMLVSARLQNGSLEKTGAGTLRLTGDNTYTGTTTVTAGVLNLASPGVLQNTTVAVNGGTFSQTGGTNNITQAGAGTHMTIASGAAYALSGGVLNFGDTVASTQAAGNGNSTLQISAGGAFSFTGGTLMNVRTIDPDPAGPGGIFTQDGGRFVVGVDGNLNTATAVRAVTTIAGDFNQNGGWLALDVFGLDTRGEQTIPPGGLYGDPLLTTITDNDILEVLGVATLSGILEIDLNGIEPETYGWYDVVVANDIQINKNSFAVSGLGVWRVITDPSNPNREILQVAVPEPASIAVWALISLCLTAFGICRRWPK